MSAAPSVLELAELLHRALQAQALHGEDAARARQGLAAAHAALRALLQERSPLVLQIAEGRVYFQGRALDATSTRVQALARDLEARAIGGLVFHLGVDADELQLLCFALLLRPARLAEMGGPRSLLPDAGHLRVLDPELPAGPVPDPEPLAEPLPPFAGPLPAVVLADELRRRLAALVQRTAATPRRTFHMPWTLEHREVMKRHGLGVPDFAGLAGTGAELGLDRLDPVTLREVLRTALSLLPPLEQGAVLLGLATLPADEQALSRALDYLGPELVAQVAAHVHVAEGPSRFELALLVAALLPCAKDRELSLEAIRGRLQFEGWGIQEVDQLREAILWECQGTDTKMQQGLADRGIFELDPRQVIILMRQVLRGRREEGLEDLLGQLETGLSSPLPDRRGQAAEILADLAQCLEDPGLSEAQEARLHRLQRAHLALETEGRNARWTCQGVEALLGHWIRKGRYEAVTGELGHLRGLSGIQDGSGARTVALRDLLDRMAGAPVLAALAPLLEEPPTGFDPAPVHGLLARLGPAAAQHLAARLRAAGDEGRRTRLAEALRALGAAGAPALRDLLGAERAEVVVQALALLADLGPAGARAEAALCLGHPDRSVRRAAVAALARLGGPEAASALAARFAEADPALQMDLLEAFIALRDPAPAAVVAEFIQAGRTADLESARLRLRAVEALGRLGSDAAVPALQGMFRRRGLLGGRESTGLRLAAAQALGALGTRPAREAMALVLDDEKDEDVRALLRQFLVGGGP